MNKNNDNYYSFVRLDLLSLVPNISGIILDVGCGTGATIKYLIDKGYSSEVLGIEYNYGAYKKAKEKGLNVLNLDIEKDEINLPLEKFDYIIFGDVLEHLYNPWAVLEKFKKYLNPDGIVLISLPNVKHYRNIRKLLFCDEWTYVEAGILDFTHIRFFTLKEAKRLIEKCGLEICFIKYKTNKNLFFRFLNLFSKKWIMTFWPEQFLIAAKIK